MLSLWADWAGSIDDKKSTSGCSFYLGSKCVAWLSRKQNSVALHTAEAEYMAACAACTQVIWMLRQLADLGVKVKLPVSVLCDNQSAIDLSKNPVKHLRSKHIDIWYHFIKDQVE